jgi:hypothetical protein
VVVLGGCGLMFGGPGPFLAVLGGRLGVLVVLGELGDVVVERG